LYGVAGSVADRDDPDACVYPGFGGAEIGLYIIAAAGILSILTFGAYLEWVTAVEDLLDAGR